jgi:hypothetical protein
MVLACSEGELWFLWVGNPMEHDEMSVTELDYSDRLPDVSQRLKTLIPLTQAAMLP